MSEISHTDILYIRFWLFMYRRRRWQLTLIETIFCMLPVIVAIIIQPSLVKNIWFDSVAFLFAAGKYISCISSPFIEKLAKRRLIMPGTAVYAPYSGSDCHRDLYREALIEKEVSPDECLVVFVEPGEVCRKRKIIPKDRLIPHAYPYYEWEGMRFY